MTINAGCLGFTEFVINSGIDNNTTGVTDCFYRDTGVTGVTSKTSYGSESVGFYPNKP